MDAHVEPSLVSRALDPAVLSTPFEIQTNWHAITGAVSCGKTTLIHALADRGFRTVAEAARPYIEQEMAAGRQQEEIFASEATQREILDLQMRAERTLRPDDVVFLDRALPDSITFFRIVGSAPEPGLGRVPSLSLCLGSYPRTTPF